MGEPLYGVVWPLGRSVCDALALANRPADLQGKTVCQLWDFAFRGDEVFAILRGLLRKRYPGIQFVDYSAFGDIHGPKQREIVGALPELLSRHKCDAVVTGIGA